MRKPEICQSTTIELKMPSVTLPSARKNDRMQEANAPEIGPLQYKAFLPLQNSTALSHSHGLEDTLEKLPIWTMLRIDELLPIKPSTQISST
jgi:hypothetical protein